MSPLEIKIMLHYYTTPEEYEPPTDSPLYPATLASFIKDGLLKYDDVGNKEITEKGTFYVNALINTPIPIASWKIPDERQT